MTYTTISEGEKNKLTIEEKIDYIYERSKKEEKKQHWKFIIKWGMVIFIVSYFLYFYLVALPSIISGVKGSLTPNIGGVNTENIIDSIKSILEGRNC